MGLPRPDRLVRLAAGAALHATATGVGLAVGTASLVGSAAGSVTSTLLAPPARTLRDAAGSVASTAVGAAAVTATAVAKAGARAAGGLITGVDDVADGDLERLAEAGKAMFEPPAARRSRRVWVSRGRAHLELSTSAVEGGPSVQRALRRQLERLDGVEWAAVNDAVGRVLVTFDERRVRVEDVVEIIAAVEQARGGTQVFPLSQEHPADLEPLVAALVTVAVDTVGIGVAYAGRVLPVPRLTRHATLALAFLDSQQWIRRALVARIGPTGTDLAFTGTSVLLHALTQSPTVPALNAAAAAARVWEMRARREVWRRREPELCRPGVETTSGTLVPPGERPGPLPDGPIEGYRGRLGPTALVAALGLLPLTFAPSRSADLLKALTPKAAVQGREAFAAVFDVRMCGRGVLPMDGSAYRRLDRVDAVVVDGATLCTGPPVVLEACPEPAGEAAGWDAVTLWTGAARLLGSDVELDEDAPGGRLRLGPGGADPERPGVRVHALRDAAGERLGTAVVTDELDPHAEALLRAVGEAGHRLVLTAHAGIVDVAGIADEVADPGESLLDTVRRVQAQGHGVLLVASGEGSVDLPGRDGARAGAADAGPALIAADVSVAPTVPGRAPAWGADLVTGPGLADACRLIAATATARALSRQCVETALTGNVLGGLLAAVGDPRRGQRRATSPGKSANAWNMTWGAWTALRADARPGPVATVHTPWHALDPDQVLRRVADRPAERATDEPAPGAGAGSAGVWKATFRTPDALKVAFQTLRTSPAVAGPVRYARTVAAELADPLTPLLGTGAAATAVLGEPTDAVLVGGAMVGSALISGFQRLRAETVLESLLLEQEVEACREIRGGADDGGTEQVPAGALRVGDVICVESGDVVPADARLLECNDLEVDESGLTGESQAVAKDVAATPGAVLADRTCMVHEGTSVVAGRARAVVVAVGAATAAGRATAAAGVAAPPAGVQARLAELTRSVLPLTLAGGGAVVGLSLLWRRPLKEAVKAGVAVAVAAVPEGLPLVATVAQQAAARRLSGRGAVVRSARVLEALGRVDTVCFDKTGTLTENRLRVVRAVPVGRGTDTDLLALAAVAGDPADAHVHEVDRAVAAAVAKREVDRGGDPESCLPFTAGRGFSAGLRDGRLVVKGAPEIVLDRCTDTGDARERVERLAHEGLRVIAVADRAVEGSPDDLAELDLEDAAHGLTLRGLVALADGVRDSTAVAIAQLRASGVRVLVATGDHPETASAIAAEAGIPDADRVVTGAEFLRASDAERVAMVRETAVFARLSPEQKVALVAALRKSGATLAMTGDGVNDAAAIRLADVGVGVGGAGGAESPAARRSADLVLTDADLTRLVDALAEGRAMWARVRNAVAVLVGGNAGEVAFTVVGTALGGRSPLGTRQLLLVNLLTDMFPALAMAVAAPRRTADPVTDPDDPLAGHPLADELRAGPLHGFTASVRELVLVRGAATAAGATGAWATGRLTGSRSRAGSMGLAALIGTQLAQTAWAGRRSPLVLVTAAGSFVVLAAVVQTPGVSRFFGCRPLGPVAWGTVLGWSVAGAAGAELVPRWLALRQEGHLQDTRRPEGGLPDNPGQPATAVDGAEPAGVADAGVPVAGPT